MPKIELKDTPAHMRELLARRYMDAHIDENAGERQEQMKIYSRFYKQHFLTSKITVKMNGEQFQAFQIASEQLNYENSIYSEQSLKFRFAIITGEFYELKSIFKRSGDCSHCQYLNAMMNTIDLMEQLVKLQEQITNKDLPYLHLCITEQINAV